MKRLLPLALSLILALGAWPRLAQAKDAAGWFELAPRLQADWRVKGDALTSKRLLIEPARSPVGRCFKVFVLTSSASSSYTIGLNKILEAFPREGLNSRFTYINYDKDKARAQAALSEIQGGAYDLVFAMGSEATSFLYKHDRSGVTPVVSVEAKDPVLLGQMKGYQTGSGTHFAFTSLNAPVSLQLSYLKTLKPGLKNLAVLYGPKNKSAIDTQVTPLVIEGQKAGISVLKVPAGWHDVTAELKVQLPLAIARMRLSDPALLNSLFWIVGSTEIFDQLHVINRLAAKIPVLSAVPDLVMAGDDSAALAIGTTFGNDAYIAALYGAAILKGDARPGELKVGLVSPPDIAISFLKARQIGLRIPFEFFEDATRIFDTNGRLVRADGSSVAPQSASKAYPPPQASSPH